MADVLENFDLEIEKNGSVISAIAKRRSNFRLFKNMGIYFTIIVPREMSCNVSSSGVGVDAIIQNGDELGLDLALSSSSVKIELKNFSGRSEKDRVKGTMNDGGIPVYMRASGGSVKVRCGE